MIKVYIYNAKTKAYIQEVTGHGGNIEANLNSGVDFTLTPPPDYENQWRWVENKWVVVPESLDSQQAKQWELLKAERSSKISSGVLVESTGKVFQTDNNSLTQYASIAGMIALDNYEPIEWKTEDNSFILLTVDIFKELQKAINENTQAAFRLAEQKRVADQPS